VGVCQNQEGGGKQKQSKKGNDQKCVGARGEKDGGGTDLEKRVRESPG